MAFDHELFTVSFDDSGLLAALVVRSEREEQFLRKDFERWAPSRPSLLGYPVEIDADLEAGVVEFRDRAGRVIARFDGVDEERCSQP